MQRAAAVGGAAARRRRPDLETNAARRLSPPRRVLLQAYRFAAAAPDGAHGSQHGSHSGGQSPQSAADIVAHAAGVSQAAFFAPRDPADTVAATPSAMIATRATMMAVFFMGASPLA